MEPFPEWVWRIPSHFNIAAACADDHCAAGRGGHPAVVVDDHRRGARTLTFAELAERTGRFAAVLAHLGVDAGERVLIRLANCIEYPAVFLGTLGRGAVAVPSSMLLTPDEVGFLAADSGAAVLVTDAATWETLGPTLRAAARPRIVVLIDAAADGTAGDTALVALEPALAGVAGPAAPARFIND